MSKITDNLYQAGWSSSLDYNPVYHDISDSDLATFDVIVTVADMQERRRMRLEQHQTLVQFPFDDAYYLPDMTKLNTVVDTVCNNLAAGRKVVVFCHQGLNRSGLVVACVLHRLHPDWSGKKILQYIRTQRYPDALFNPTFAEYVMQLAGPERRAA